QLRNWINGLGGERRVRARRDPLYRVVLNLRPHGLDAGAQTATRRAQTKGGFLVGGVGGDGPGGPPRVAPHAFHPFPLGGGAGLGLCIARDLVRAHGGEIVLAETGDKGTSFRFTLPLNGGASATARPSASG